MKVLRNRAGAYRLGPWVLGKLSFELFGQKVSVEPGITTEILMPNDLKAAVVTYLHVNPQNTSDSYFQTEIMITYPSGLGLSVSLLPDLKKALMQFTSESDPPIDKYDQGYGKIFRARDLETIQLVHARIVEIINAVKELPKNVILPAAKK
jgi:hypothetical protein